MISNTIKTSVR